MLHGDEKVKSISRSVLPASRRMAKNVKGRKRSWNQTTRRRMDREITDFFVPGSTADEIEDAYLDSGSTHVDAYNPDERHSMTRIRNRRRRSDKLGPITRWTASQVKNFNDPEDLIAHVSDLLPNNLAGRHALSHMRIEFAPDATLRRWRSRRTPANAHEEAVHYAIWEHLVTTLFEHDHKALNRAIKAHRGTTVKCYSGCTVLNYYGDPRITQTEVENDTDEFVICRECGRRLRNNNLPLIRSAEDIPLFIERLALKVDPWRHRHGDTTHQLVGTLQADFARIQKAAA